jgi:hypothetical protein
MIISILFPFVQWLYHVRQGDFLHVWRCPAGPGAAAIVRRHRHASLPMSAYVLEICFAITTSAEQAQVPFTCCFARACKRL